MAAKVCKLVVSKEAGMIEGVGWTFFYRLSLLIFQIKVLFSVEAELELALHATRSGQFECSI